MCTRHISFDACIWILIATLSLVASGCGSKDGKTTLTVNVSGTISSPNKPESGISLTDEPQSGIFFVRLDLPFERIVDLSGTQLRMPDDMEIVMEPIIFDRRIKPLLGPQDTTAKMALVRVDADFQLEKDSVTIGVTQDEDGGANEESKTYWVVKLKELRSAEWYRSSD